MLKSHVHLSPVDRTLKQVRAAGAMLTWKHPFFGPAWAWVTIRVGAVGTACIDERGVMTVDPEFWAEQDKPTRIFVVAHELTHLILLHHKRLGGRDPLRWNYAGDRWINQTCREANLAAPDWALFPLLPAHGELAVEDLYELEPAQPEPEPSQPGKPGDQPGQPGKPGDKPGQPGKPGDKPGQPGQPGKPGDKPGQSQGKPAPRPGEGCGVVPASPQDNDDARTEGETFTGQVPDWGRIAAQCAAASQGTDSGKVLRRVTDAPPGRVPVKRLLRHAFSQAKAAHGRDDFTWKKRSRRALDPEGPCLPGFTSRTATAVLVIDTSGSMGDEAIAQVIKWSRAIGAELGVRVFVVGHTCRAYFHQWVDAAATADEYHRILDESGGTSFKDAFDKVAAVKRTKFDVMVQFTDGECSWPNPQKPPNVRRHVVALVGTRCKGYVPKSGCRVVDATLD